MNKYINIKKKKKTTLSRGDQRLCQETVLHKRRQHVNTTVWSVQTGTC